MSAPFSLPPPAMSVARSELILGGQRSGKTFRAESLAAAWLAGNQGRRAVYLATAQAWDEEMHQRIQQHRMARALRVPGLATVEEPQQLARAVQQHANADTLIVVDCLTLWLTGRLMPAPEAVASPAPSLMPPTEELLQAIAQCTGPLVLVSNEIGLGVIPMGRDVRGFVDALGALNQQAARACARVTFMAAGLPMVLKAEEGQAP